MGDVPDRSRARGSAGGVLQARRNGARVGLWEFPLARDDGFDPGSGHAIVAHIQDSDVADVRGLHDGRTLWRWVFGEDILAGPEGRPVDGMDLEEYPTRPIARAQG